MSLLQHDPHGELPLSELWQTLSGRPAAFEEEIQQARRLVLEGSLAGDLEEVAQRLLHVARHDIATRDLTLGAIRRALDVYKRQVLENEHNAAHLLRDGFDAQWNDDGHNTLHALLTFENESYYADYAQAPTRKLATCLEQGFVYQGQVNRHGPVSYTHLDVYKRQ